MILQKINPIIIDIETSGINAKKNAIIEITLINTKLSFDKKILPNKVLHLQVIPFNNSKINKTSLKCNKIDLFQKLRFPINEKEATIYILEFIKKTMIENKNKCTLIGHNCWFDLIFFNNLISRTKKTNIYCHKFNIIDIATLGISIYKQKTLSNIAKKIGLKLNNKLHHSAIYDAKITTLIFCHIMNDLHIKFN